MLPTLRTATLLAYNTTRRRTQRYISTDVRFPASAGSQTQTATEPQGAQRVNQSSLPSNSISQTAQDINSNAIVPVLSARPSGIPSSEATAHPFAGAKEYEENQEQVSRANTPSNLPALPKTKLSDASSLPMYSKPPFDTHHFFVKLETTFPASTARSLMRATCALVVDRIGRVRRGALTTKDLENQAYLFRAALSEARNEISLQQRKEFEAIRSSMATLRRELDALDIKMKSDIANLKHELQIDVDNRKTESKTDLKQMDISLEDVLNKSIVSIGDMKATNEEMKWENMRRAVVALGAFAITIIVIFEFSHASSSKPTPSGAAPTTASDDNAKQLLEVTETP